jgi:predicted transposase YbfD/YdcC
MVSAFCAANDVVIGQVKTAEKSKEITAIPELLKLLNISGCLVTIDSMGCQKKIATEILNGKGDYLLVVKCNQKRLEQAFDDIFDLSDLQNENTYGVQEQSHGR